MARSRVTYVLEITGSFEKNGDYYSTTETLDWFISRANQDAGKFRVLLQEGATEPKPIPNAKVKITKILLDELREGA